MLPYQTSTYNIGKRPSLWEDLHHLVYIFLQLIFNSLSSVYIYLLLLFEKTTILEPFFIAILGGRLKEVLLHKTNTILLSNRYNRSTITASRPHVDFKQLDSQHLSLHGCHSAQKSLLTHTLFPIYFSINIILFIYLSIYPYVIYLSTYTHWQTKYCTKKELCECNDNICKWL